MTRPYIPSGFSTFLVTLAIMATMACNPQLLRADDAKPPTPDEQKMKARLDRLARQREITGQAEGIHKITDGSIVVKSGPGLAVIHADGHGCATGCNGNGRPPNADDNDLMAGIFVALFADPQGTNLGIGIDQAAKLKAAYNYMDLEGTHPDHVLKVYEKYARAAEGQAKTDAEKTLMDKVRAVGQAYIDAEIKKRKDIKALLTPDQAGNLRAIGAKMLRPFEKPVA